MSFLVILLVAAVVAILTLPFWRPADGASPLGPHAALDQERIDLELEREILLSSLAELEIERVRSKLADDDYERLKATDERRLLNALTRLDALAATVSGPGVGDPGIGAPAAEPRAARHWAVSLTAALFVLGGGTGVYLYLFSVQESRVAAFQRQAGESMPDPREMVVRLEARLRDNPNDLEGQVMAGRSYMVLDRLDEAARAWTKVLELDSRNGEAHFNIGVLLLTTRKVNDPQLFQQALDHFDIAYVKLPQEPALLWYRGIVYVHVGRFNDADESWTAAYQNLQPGSEDAEFVRKALEQLRAGTPPLF